MQENIALLDFALSAEEFADIDTLDKAESGRCGRNSDVYEGF
jgi:diketogulonate reductase-like aldo/keto reductase